MRLVCRDWKTAVDETQIRLSLYGKQMTYPYGCPAECNNRLILSRKISILSLSHPVTENLVILKDVPSLTNLHLSNSPTDLSQLLEVTQLSHLRLSNLRDSHLEYVAAMNFGRLKRLKYLHLEAKDDNFNKIIRLSNLPVSLDTVEFASGWPEITSDCVAFDKMILTILRGEAPPSRHTGFSWLKHFKYERNLSDRECHDLRFLLMSKQLETLWISIPTLKGERCEPLQQLTALKSLFIHRAEYEDIGSWSWLVNLENLQWCLCHGLSSSINVDDIDYDSSGSVYSSDESDRHFYSVKTEGTDLNHWNGVDNLSRNDRRIDLDKRIYDRSTLTFPMSTKTFEVGFRKKICRDSDGDVIEM